MTRTTSCLAALVLVCLFRGGPQRSDASTAGGTKSAVANYVNPQSVASACTRRSNSHAGLATSAASSGGSNAA